MITSAATTPFLGIAQCVTLTAFTVFGINMQPLLYFVDVICGIPNNFEPLVTVLPSIVCNWKQLRCLSQCLMLHVDHPDQLIISSGGTKHLLMVLHQQASLHIPSVLTEYYLAKLYVVSLGQVMDRLSFYIVTWVSCV